MAAKISKKVRRLNSLKVWSAITAIALTVALLLTSLPMQVSIDTGGMLSISLQQARANPSFTARTETYFDAASLDSPYDAVIDKPTGTAEGDILFALVVRQSSVASVIDSTPTNWISLGESLFYELEGSAYRYASLYYKIATDDEPASYTWSFDGTVKARIVCSCYYGDFNSADPIDVVSNTIYNTTNNICRAASMNVTAANSPLVFWGALTYPNVQTFTKPTVPTEDWVEDDEAGSTASGFSCEVCSMIWTGSGATGDMDATMAIATVNKHAFAVALNPAGAPAPDGWLSDWAKRVTVTVNASQLTDSNDLTWFPVMLELGTSVGMTGDDVSCIFDEVGDNWQKIAVTTSDGETELYVEIEKWDDANEQAWLWVSKTGWVIDSETDTTLYLYYDSTHADNDTYVGDPGSTTAQNVWDSNFKFVSHMTPINAYFQSIISLDSGAHNGRSCILTLTPSSSTANVKVRDSITPQWLDAYEHNWTLASAYNGSSELKIWLFSDPHIGVLTHENVEADIADIDDNVGDVDYVLVLGDITNTGTTTQYDDYLTAKATSDVSSNNWYEITGNHDFDTNDTNFKTKLGYDTFYYSFDIDNMHFIMCGDLGNDSDMAGGEWDAAYLSWLETDLAANTDKNIIVCSHEPPLASTIGSTPEVAPWNEYLTEYIDEYWTLICQTPNIMWFHGHNHGDVYWPYGAGMVNSGEKLVSSIDNEGGYMANNGVAVGATGVADGAVDFGGDDSIALGSYSICKEPNQTVEAWTKYDAFTGYPTYSENDAGGVAYILGFVTSDSDHFPLFQIASSDSQWHLATGTTNLGTGTLYYLAGTLSSATGMAIYLNGQSEDTDPNKVISTATITKTRLGSRYSGATEGSFLDGIIDEVRLSDVARSAAWILATYETSRDNLLYWGEEDYYAEIANAPDSYGFGILEIGSTACTAIDYFTLNNTGNCPVDVTIQGTNLAGGDDTWVLSGTATPGENIYGLKAGLDDDDDLFDVVVNATANAFVGDLAEDATQDWGLKIWMPTALSGYDANQMSGNVTLIASVAS